MASFDLGLTREDIFRPLLYHGKGRKGIQVENIVDQFRKYRNITVDLRKCKLMKNLQRSLTRRWKKGRSYKEFAENNKVWL